MTENETEFLIIDVSDVPRHRHGDTAKGNWQLAFGKVPIGKALFKPALNAGGSATSLSRRYPERSIHTRLDNERNGVWFWWEPKTEDGSKP